jgi:pimeloyl-ACP methyl ester carboxylesterase
MIGSDRYESYGCRLNSWGYVAIRWEPLGEFLPVWVDAHSTLANMLHVLVEWVHQQGSEKGSPLFGLLDMSRGVSLVGHSRGAKVNSLCAARKRTAVTAVVNLDPGPLRPTLIQGFRLRFELMAFHCPVDISGFDEMDVEVLPILSQATAAFLTIGSQLGPETLGGAACAPKGQGYQQFFAQSRSPAWMIEVCGILVSEH